MQSPADLHGKSIKTDVPKGVLPNIAAIVAWSLIGITIATASMMSAAPVAAEPARTQGIIEE
ncbi:hypothetical protein EVC37_02530 [Methylocaldum sp. BRCS4]|nr:hypothetical protein [Methylocaldum sp. BRCS4]